MNVTATPWGDVDRERMDAATWMLFGMAERPIVHMPDGDDTTVSLCGRASGYARLPFHRRRWWSPQRCYYCTRLINRRRRPV